MIRLRGEKRQASRLRLLLEEAQAPYDAQKGEKRQEV